MEKTILGKPIKALKISVKRPPDVPKFRGLLKDWKEIRNEYEYGISFYRRYLIDKDIVPMKWVRVEGSPRDYGLMVDETIEAKEIKGIDKDEKVKINVMAFDIELAEENGEGKIIMISFRNSKEFKFFHRIVLVIFSKPCVIPIKINMCRNRQITKNGYVSIQAHFVFIPAISSRKMI